MHPILQVAPRAGLAVLPRVLGAAVCVLGLSLTARAETGSRYKKDADEMLWMKSAHPGAWQKVDAGETLLGAARSPADVEKAADLFQQAAREAKESALAARRQCQALTALGRHDDAVAACDAALTRSGKVLDLRAMVGALMSGPYAPSGSETGRALFYARRATEIAPEAPWGYAAECDVAEKLGDTEMLRSCAGALARVAPGHYETARATEILVSVRPGLRLVVGWVIVALVVLGTAVHGLRRAWRGSAVARGAATLATVTCLALAAGPARAGEGGTAPGSGEYRPAIAGHLSKHPISDADPVSSVPSPAERDKDPLDYGYFLMDLGDAADHAIARGDHLAAARFYSAIVKAVPDAAVGFRKTCEQYEAGSDLTNARTFCAAALTLKDVTVADYSQYARVVLARASGSIDPADLTNLDSVVAHLKKEPGTQTVAWDIECNVGVHLADVARLRACSVPWAALLPNDPKVIFYGWVLALHEKDYGTAQRLLTRARAVGLPTDQIRHMEQVTLEVTPFWRKGFRDWRFGAALGGIVIGALLGLAVRRRSATHVSA